MPELHLSRTREGTIANIAYLLLFPLYFFQQSALTLGIIPSWPGGYFGAVSAALSLPLMWGLFMSRVKSETSGFGSVDAMFLAIGLILACRVLYSYGTGELIGIGRGELELMALSMSGLLHNFVLYALARMMDFNSALFRRLNLFMLAGMVAVVFAYQDNGLFALGLHGDSAQIGTYQNFARSLCVAGLLAYLFIDNPFYRNAVAVVCTIALFLNGARSEFVLFMLSIFLFTAIRLPRNLAVRVIAGFGAAAFLILGILYLHDIVSSLPQTRILELFDLGGSTSARERDEFAAYAFETISRNPVLGGYGSYLVRFGEVGTNAHNLLSAWVDLGFPGILLYVWLSFLMLRGSIRRAVLTSTIEVDAALLFTIFAIATLLFSKGYTFPVFGMAVGFYSRIQSPDKAHV